MPASDTISGGQGLIASRTIDRMSKRKVLLVEDDALVRMFVMDLLVDLHFDVIESWDAASALAALGEAISIDLLVTDVTLPGRDGPAIAAEVRRRDQRLPVLFTTGHSDFVWREPVGDGPVAVLAKPFDVAAFDAALRLLLTA